MSIDDSLIQTEIKSTVQIIRLNRPDKQNALTQSMYLAMIEAMCAAADNDQISCVMLAATGKHFTAGNDISDFLAADLPIQEMGAVRWLNYLAKFPKPVIAQIRGNAIGVGTTCLLHCDLVISDHSAHFKMPFNQLGLSPEAGASLLLPKKVGATKATEWLLLGRSIYAQEALSSGLVNEVVSADCLEARTDELIDEISVLPRESLRITKQLLRREEESLSDRMALEFKLFEKQLHSETAKKIFQKFLNS